MLSKIELAHEAGINCIGINYSGRFIISGATDGSIAISDIEKRELTHRYDEKNTAHYCKNPSPR